VAGSIKDILAADLTGDGLPEIIIIDRDKKTIDILVGDARLSYSRRFSIGYSGLGERLIGAADFSGDGKIDIAVDAATGSALFTLFPGKGNGELLTPKIIRPPKTEPDFGDAAVLDFDGNGRPDIAGLLNLNELVPSSLAVFRNLGGSKFSMIKLEEAFYSRLSAGDFNGDGFDDIIVRAKNASTLVLFQADGAGSFLKGRTITTPSSGTLIAAGYVNADKRLDLAGEGVTSPYGWTLMGKGNGTFWKPAAIPGSWSELDYDMVLADVTGDGNTDLFASSPSTYYGHILLYPGNGSAKLGSPSDIAQVKGYVTHCSGRNLCAADVNKDQKPDVLAAHYAKKTGYDNPESYEMQNVLLFLSGVTPVRLAISNLQFTTLSYNSQYVTMAGSFTFENSGGDVRYASSPTSLSGAFLEFHVGLKFPNNWISSGDYWVSGSFLHMPDQKTGTISFSITLPIRSQASGTPKISITGFTLYDANLVRSNELSYYQ
jgi:hypothetical protein